MANRGRAAGIALFLCLFPGAAGAGADPIDDRIAALLPRHTIGLFALDLDACSQKAPNLWLARLLADEEVSEFLAPAFEALRKDEGMRPLLSFLDGVRESGLLDALAGPIHLTFVGVSVQQGDQALRFFDALSPADESIISGQGGIQINPAVTVLVRVRDAQAADQAFDRLLALATGWKREDREEQGVTYRYVSFPDKDPWASFAYGFAGDLFVLSQNPARLVTLARHALDAQATPENRRFLADERFGAWRRRFAGDETVFAGYMSLERLNEAVPIFPLQPLPGLAAVGVTVSMDGPEIGDGMTFLFEGEDWRNEVPISLFQPADLSALGPPTPGAVVRAVAAFSPDAAAGALTGAIASFGAFVSFEELGPALDGRLVVEAALPSAGFVPKVWGRVLLSDSQAAAETLARIAEGSGDLVGTFDAGVGEAYFVRSDGFFSPAFAVAGDSLLLASSPGVFRERWARLPSPADSGAREAPEEGSVFRLEADLPRIVEWGLSAAEPFLGTALANAPVPLDPGLVPLPDTVASYLTPLRAEMRMERDALSFGSRPPVSALALVGGLLVSPVTVQRADFEDSGPPVGSVAPDIEGVDLDGEPFRLSHYRGTVIMLDFWGHW